MHCQSSRHIYALLVGIDRYPAPIPSLQGCVNDTIALQQYLQNRVNQEQSLLHLLTLRNEAATRQAIINGFRQHLCRAGQNDVVLFAYSGHGSQIATPPELWHLEPDRLNETLVCYNSRTQANWDLADIELDQLIAEVAERNPHITVILDCCHSQSGTRDWQAATVRQIPIDERERPISSYIIASEQSVRAIASPPFSPPLRQLRRGRHIVLAACREREAAKEYRVNGEKRGAFSYFLIDALKRANRPLTYRDLFNQARALVLLSVADQHPQLEATHVDDLEQPFLGGVVEPCLPYFTVSYHKQQGWIINGGAVHGLPSATGDDAIALAIFPLDSPPEHLQRIPEAIAQATVTDVLPHLSRVEIQPKSDRSLDTTQIYKALVIHQPLPPIQILLEGDISGVEHLRQSLNASGFEWPSSLRLHITENRESAEFCILAHDERYSIIHLPNNHPLVSPIANYAPSSAAQVLQQLSHIIRWFRIANLTNSVTSQIDPNAVQLWVEWYTGQTIERYQASDLPDGQVFLHYRDTQKPTFRVKLTNTAQQPLYCVLLNLTGRFAIHTGLLAGGGIWLEPGQEVWAYFGRSIYGVLLDVLWQQGVTEYRDILKLIVSTAEFDATLLEQSHLDTPYTPSFSPTHRSRGTLKCLLSQVTPRDLQPQADVYDDWVTHQVLFHLIRPQPAVSISPSISVALGYGVTLAPHPSFQAQVRLTSVSHIYRTIKRSAQNLLHEALHEHLTDTLEPFCITPGIRNDPGLSALELSNIRNYESITSADPLTIWIETRISQDEQIVAVAHHGQSSSIVGYSKLNRETIEISLESLPKTSSDGSIDQSEILYIEFCKLQKNHQMLSKTSAKSPILKPRVKSLEGSLGSDSTSTPATGTKEFNFLFKSISEGRKIKFIMNKYFWQTSLAIAMILLLAILGIKFLDRSQSSRLKRQSLIFPEIKYDV